MTENPVPVVLMVQVRFRTVTPPNTISVRQGMVGSSNSSSGSIDGATTRATSVVKGGLRGTNSMGVPILSISAIETEQGGNSTNNLPDCIVPVTMPGKELPDEDGKPGVGGSRDIALTMTFERPSGPIWVD